MKANRILNTIFAFALLFAMLFSFVFVSANAGHTCDGCDCPICACMEACEAVLTGAALLAVAVAFTFFIPQVVAPCTTSSSKGYISHTLISLKVKLSC